MKRSYAGDILGAVLGFAGAVGAWAECRDGASPVTVTGEFRVTLDGSDYRSIGTDYSLYEPTRAESWAIYAEGPFFGEKTAMMPGNEGAVDPRLSGFIGRAVRVTGCMDNDSAGFIHIDTIASIEVIHSKP